MRRLLLPIALVAVVAVTVEAEHAQPATPLRYSDVQPVFEKHCAKCHDARLVKNPAAQAVFEMSNGYPFATQRPGSLLADLRRAFGNRGMLSSEEKQRGVSWIDGGGLDTDGKPPAWH